VQPSYTFYEVAGGDVDAIETSLRERGPRDERGKRRFAFTDWAVEWEWKRTNTGTVDPESLALKCSAEIRLPHLKVTPDTSLETIRQWHEFIERTRKHELAHLEHVQSGAMRIKDKILEARRRGVALTPSRANKIVSQGVQELRAFDVAYDARTEHGYVEGTWKVLADILPSNR
jgi:predicted secreted Zn-dependent protease